MYFVCFTARGELFCVCVKTMLVVQELTNAWGKGKCTKIKKFSMCVVTKNHNLQISENFFSRRESL